MIGKINLSVFNEGVNFIKIGELKQEIIDALNINCSPCDIILWKDRFKYTEKHKSDFKSEDEYLKHMSELPSIINNPDYIGLHPSNNSIQYIKRIDEIMLVGIRIKTKGNINFRSAYPISEENLSRYIEAGTIIKFSKISSNLDKTE